MGVGVDRGGGSVRVIGRFIFLATSNPPTLTTLLKLSRWSYGSVPRAMFTCTSDTSW